MKVWHAFDAPVVVTGAALVVITGAALVVSLLDVELEFKRVAGLEFEPEVELAAVRFFVDEVVVGDEVVAGTLGLVGYADATDPSVIFACVMWKPLTPK